MSANFEAICVWTEAGDDGATNCFALKQIENVHKLGEACVHEGLEKFAARIS